MTKNEVNIALERAHSGMVILQEAIKTAKLPEAERERLLPLVVRVKTALDQASAGLAVARHEALRAIESL